MGATATTHAVLIAEKFDEAVSVAFANTMALAWLGPPIVQQGDSGIRWEVHTTRNTSGGEVTEGDPPGAAGQQAFSEALVPWRIFTKPVEVTYTAVRRTRGASTTGRDALAEELERAQTDIVDDIVGGLLDTSAGGIQGAVDSGTNYAGITRASTTEWQSLETAVGGALTLTQLQNASESLRQQPRMSMWDCMFSEENQRTNYQDLMTNSANVLASPVRFRPGAGDNADLGFDQDAVFFQNKPWFAMPELTNTVILFIRKRDWSWKQLQAISGTGVDVTELGKTREHFNLLLGIEVALKCQNPRAQGKLTGVTA